MRTAAACALALVLTCLGALAGSAALAQPADPHAGHDHRPIPPAGRTAVDPHAGHDHGPVAAPAGEAPGAHGEAEAGEGAGFQNSRVAALLFWVLAALTLGGALFVITRRNLIAAVMGMVGTFFALAGLYAMLYAHFLAVIQVLVYAGAIMVLFVFVIMILNRPEDEPWAVQGLFGKALAGLAILYLVVRLSGVLWDVKDQPHAQIAAPMPQPVSVAVRGGAAAHPSVAPPSEDAWGSTRSVGRVLFGEYLFPFEAVSLVLLVAVVGGIAVARPHVKHPDTPTPPEAV